jgi:hypothetical protein
MVSFDTIIQYFSFFGALVACVLGVLKIFDYFNNRPKLRIREVGNCYYQYAPKDEKTEFIFSLEITNVGRRTTVVKRVEAYPLSNRKKELTVYGDVFKVEKTLEPSAYVKVDCDFEISQRIPREKYFVKVKIRTTNKTYVHYISMLHFDDWVEPLNKWQDERRAKGLLE